MNAFLVGHATHPDWRQALALAALQVDGQRARHEASDDGPLSLGFVYFSDHFAADADALVADLKRRWPGVAWVGSVAVGVVALGVEYIDEPALVLMLAALPSGRFEVFSGAHKLRRIAPHTALVHADPATPDLAELLGDMSDRVSSGYLFGGLASSRGAAVHVADGAWRGGLSGVAFSREVALMSRVTQGCQPVGPQRRVTAAERNRVLTLDGEPALLCLLRDLGLADLAAARTALPRLRNTLVGLSDAPAPGATRAPASPAFGDDMRVRHLVGLDPAEQAVAVADRVEPGSLLAFCVRDVASARRDLVRICSAIRDEIESATEPLTEGASASAPEAPAPSARRIAGALYISCAGRGGPHFGGPSAELQIVQHALTGGGAELPLVGFFAGGEIAHHHLYGYTGVLTVFTAPH
jgi:small ligand-binding sensory domain FIST